MRLETEQAGRGIHGGQICYCLRRKFSKRLPLQNLKQTHVSHQQALKARSLPGEHGQNVRSSMTGVLCSGRSVLLSMHEMAEHARNRASKTTCMPKVHA